MSATTGSEQIPLAGRRETSHAHIRLHGHPLGANAAEVSLAEAIGTFFLVLTITSTVISATLDKPVAGLPSVRSPSPSPGDSCWRPRFLGSDRSQVPT